jgi:hypothetical protein
MTILYFAYFFANQQMRACVMYMRISPRRIALQDLKAYFNYYRTHTTKLLSDNPTISYKLITLRRMLSVAS